MLKKRIICLKSIFCILGIIKLNYWIVGLHHQLHINLLPKSESQKQTHKYTKECTHIKGSFKNHIAQFLPKFKPPLPLLCFKD